jgi:cytochrome c55X
MKRWLCGLAASIVAVVAGAAEPGADKQEALKYMLRHDCGSCHGMRLTGGLGPPLTREALAGRPVEFVAATILLGREGTAMPPWQGLIDADEARWLAGYLVDGEME